MIAGTAMPPIAAAIGMAALRGEASSPTSSSRLISSPTTKKKITIRPSLTQCASEWLSWNVSVPIVT